MEKNCQTVALFRNGIMIQGLDCGPYRIFLSDSFNDCTYNCNIDLELSEIKLNL